MDQTDIHILEEFQLNRRITMTELGKKVALILSAAAGGAWYRRACEENGASARFCSPTTK